MIVSSLAPLSANFVISVWRVSWSLHFTFALRRTFFQAVLNVVIGFVASYWRAFPVGNTNWSALAGPIFVHRGKTVNGVAVPAAGAAATAAAAGRGAAAAPAPTLCGRQMATAPAGGTAGGITHDSQTEGYYIVSGGGTMFTDGYIVNGRHNPSPDLNGPTCSGTAYEVLKKVVKPGDIIIIPAGVVHGWLDIPEHVEYLSFRPSPGILNAGYVHPVLK